MKDPVKTSIKGKIIIVIVVSMVALVSSYFINKLAFRSIYRSVDKLSAPNKKLIAVNSLFFEINESAKAFRIMINKESKKAFDDFAGHSARMKTEIDSLAVLCTDNPYQAELIDSISSLIRVRNNLFKDYASFRLFIKKNNAILRQTRLLDSLLSSNRNRFDSLLHGNESQVTTVQVDSLSKINNDREKQSFWNRIFRPNRKIKEVEIIREIESSTTDTLVLSPREETYKEVRGLLNRMVSEQKDRRKLFYSRENEFARFEDAFNSNITQLLSAVEKDIIAQTELTLGNAESEISHTMERIFLIIAFFFLFSFIILILLLTDMTKSNKYRRLLVEAKETAELHSQARQRFLSNMSHEIRTPLQSIVGYTEQIRNLGRFSEEYIDALHQSSEHLLEVVNEILDYDRVTSGRFVFDKKAFDMRLLIDEVVSIMAPQVESRGLRLVLKIHLTKTTSVSGDPFRLKQVLLNLLGNAVKFTREGDITLSIRDAAEDGNISYTFIIRDTGIGIPPEKLSSIFDQFEQANLTGEDKYKGTGLGLSIVKALIEEQGGEIFVSSEVDQGTSFTFHLSYEIAAPGPERGTEAREIYDTRLVAWLVDDDRLITKLCSDILAKHGIMHECFDSGESLLAHPAAYTPSMVFTDIRLPGMSGIRLLQEIRQKYGQRTRIIAVTAQALPEERMEMQSRGFDGILIKPFTERGFMSFFQTGNVPGGENDRVSPQPELLNTAELLKMLDHDEPALHDILSQYAAESRDDITAIRVAMSKAKPDIFAIRDYFHRLSGRTSQIGSLSLGKEIRRLETALSEGKEHDLHGETEHIIQLLELLLAEIERRTSESKKGLEEFNP